MTFCYQTGHGCGNPKRRDLAIELVSVSIQHRPVQATRRTVLMAAIEGCCALWAAGEDLAPKARQHRVLLDVIPVTLGPG
jgi:hypothetical protein